MCIVNFTRAWRRAVHEEPPVPEAEREALHGEIADVQAENEELRTAVCGAECLWDEVTRLEDFVHQMKAQEAGKT